MLHTKNKGKKKRKRNKMQEKKREKKRGEKGGGKMGGKNTLVSCHMNTVPHATVFIYCIYMT